MGKFGCVFIVWLFDSTKQSHRVESVGGSARAPDRHGAVGEYAGRLHRQLPGVLQMLQSKTTT